MTDLYAVIGNPIGHTKSPLIHRMFAEATRQHLEYVAIEGPFGGFAVRVDQFRHDGGRGLNVTVPFKLDACAYATDLSDRARMAGAANALKFEGDRTHAENFDGVGLANDIQRNLGYSLAGKRILVLGAGGAARGVILPFLAGKPAVLAIANRTPGKAHMLAEQFSVFGGIVAIEYADLAGLPPFDLVVNATSASLSGDLPPVPEASFAKGCLAYELAYGKGLTPFLKIARSGGASRLADGVGMLVEQAAEAFKWWRGIRPDTVPVIKRLTVPLV
jgi:shikimate dehydrogenase